MGKPSGRLGIELLTLLGMPPVEHVQLAAELGCISISSGLTGLPLAAFGYVDLQLNPEWSLESNPALRRELKAALRDSGVHIGLAEGFRVRPDGDVREWIAALPPGVEIGLEVPQIQRFLDGMSPREHAAEVVAAARALGA